MNVKCILLILLLVFTISVSASDPAAFTYNSRKDIAACKGKLVLQLVRVWGGDNEEDENKFFKSPADIRLGTNKRVYIMDQYNHRLSVFEQNGKFIRHIGQKGQGPGDLYLPGSMALFPNEDLAVYESATRRLQLFSPGGESKKILKKTQGITWLDINSKSQYVVHQRSRMLETRKLIFILDEKGNTLKEIGAFKDPVIDDLYSDRPFFSKDHRDYIYAANGYAPLIRVYTPGGGMTAAIVYEPPFKIPVKISLNEEKDEIRREEPVSKSKTRVLPNGKTITIKGIGERRPYVARGIAVDSQKRIFLLTWTRSLTTKEDFKDMPGVGSTRDFFKVYNFEKADSFIKGLHEILVFGPDGKIIAKAPFEDYPGKMYIKGNRIFFAEGFIRQRILEFEYRVEI